MVAELHSEYEVGAPLPWTEDGKSFISERTHRRVGQEEDDDKGMTRCTVLAHSGPSSWGNVKSRIIIFICIKYVFILGAII